MPFLLLLYFLGSVSSFGGRPSLLLVLLRWPKLIWWECCFLYLSLSRPISRIIKTPLSFGVSWETSLWNVQQTSTQLRKIFKRLLIRADSMVAAAAAVVWWHGHTFLGHNGSDRTGMCDLKVSYDMFLLSPYCLADSIALLMILWCLS